MVYATLSLALCWELVSKPSIAALEEVLKLMLTQ